MAIDGAIALAALGLEVIFVGAVGPVSPGLLSAPLRVVCLDQAELLGVARHPGVVLQALWNRKAGRAVEAILADLDPASTVVHVHGYTKALSAMPVMRARNLGFAVVCTLHDFFAACPNGAFFDYAAGVPCERVALSWECGVARCDKRSHAHKLFRVARGWVQRNAAQFPQAVRDYIVLSQRSAAILQRYLPDDARFHRVPHGMDLQKLPPVRVAAQQELLCIGRLEEEKGVRLLGETAARLGMRVTFVGDGPLRDDLEALPGMTVTGWLERDQVFAAMERARCLVFPSLWYETYGLVVGEAASRGIPAVVSDVSAPSERVTDGVDGWVFRSGDAGALATALLHTHDDAAIAAAGQAAYDAYWLRHASRHDHAAALLSIYQVILSAK